MTKPQTHIFKSTQDAQDFIINNDLEISKHVVNVILDNINTKKKSLLCYIIVIEEENLSIEIVAHNNEFIKTLNIHLSILEQYEEYELCYKIKEVLDKLSNN
jgi:hypothetical protein